MMRLFFVCLTKCAMMRAQVKQLSLCGSRLSELINGNSDFKTEGGFI